MTQMKRRQQLKQWLADCFDNAQLKLSPLTGDASFRSYLRLSHQDKDYIVMDAPPPQEDTRPFVDIAKRLCRLGLNVPHIYHQNLELGFLVLSDLGNTDYFSAINDTNADELYKAAIDALLLLQTTPQEGLLPFNADHIQTELSLFTTWYLKAHLGIKNLPDLSELFEALIENALSQKQVPIHRDYHCRNLMSCDTQPGILDFQDMMIGPYSYDLVSLLRDCYIAWPEERVQNLIKHYLTQSGFAPDNFHSQFDLMGLQRHLKAVGIFARLNHRDKNPNYLKSIPQTLKYVQAIADKYVIANPLIDIISEHA